MFTSGKYLSEIILNDLKRNDSSRRADMDQTETEALRDLITELESRLLICRSALNALKELELGEDAEKIIDAGLSKIDFLYSTEKPGNA